MRPESTVNIPRNAYMQMQVYANASISLTRNISLINDDVLDWQELEFKFNYIEDVIFKNLVTATTGVLFSNLVRVLANSSYLT